ncbi:MAG: carbamoyltransferase HypF [Chlorobi bacterium]|nr:carbamoyltransferase HypF [Chlorobiota bacterium]
MPKPITNSKQNYLIKISGLVQGVGFRPFIYRLAEEFGLTGWVENRNDGVLIKVSSANSTISQFIESIKSQAPLASNIYSITVNKAETEEFKNFYIKKSTNVSNHVTEISPDIAVCDECLYDMKHQKHRIDYPFINCTNCGPRFTIIKSLPYDRQKTTMHEFNMCEICEAEYKTITNRRFHAQPVACNHCGPVYSFTNSTIKTSDLNLILEHLKEGIEKGKFFAIKGLGGFHLMCDALNNIAVSELRNLKKRDGKPFAVMFKNITELKKYAVINKVEEKLLNSWRRPIVLLQKKEYLAYEVCNGLTNIGAMLPYMPFHYLLFERLKTPAIVLTSGNFSDEPILISNNKALESFNNKVNGIITYNRKIFNRTDDSVTMVINNIPRILRRSRGYTPHPIRTNLNVESILAVGAELVNSFAIGKGNQAILSQYIGDLKNFETYEFYKETYHRFSKLFKFRPEIVACDLHPDYLSSQFAELLLIENKNLKIVKVQHHHAHIASVMLDNNLDEKIIGVSFDGIGLGTDNHIWGGEFLVTDLLDFERYSHFDYIPMPGGDKATKEPWRMAFSYLYSAFGDDVFNLPLPLFEKIKKKNITSIKKMIDNKINAPLTSSAGRLFDAITGILGINLFSSFHAEAPMRLESIIKNKINSYYDFEFVNETISFSETIRQIVIDVENRKSNSEIAAKFHNTINRVIITKVNEISKQTGIKKVVLSGGTFQNKYITSKIETALAKENLKVYVPHSIPVNDQGIAIGQLAIASKKKI